MKIKIVKSDQPFLGWWHFPPTPLPCRKAAKQRVNTRNIAHIESHMLVLFFPTNTFNFTLNIESVCRTHLIVRVQYSSLCIKYCSYWNNISLSPRIWEEIYQHSILIDFLSNIHHTGLHICIQHHWHRASMLYHVWIFQQVRDNFRIS